MEANMNAIVIYESLTGNTKKAAELIVDELIANGVSAVASPTTDVDYQSLANADLVIVGSWTDGLFLFGQKPASAGRLSQIPFLAGKQAAVFCTYALETGKTLEKLEAIIADRGADVIGGMAIRRNKLQEGSAEFVSRLLGVVTV
jgi:flavodoxin